MFGASGEVAVSFRDVAGLARCSQVEWVVVGATVFGSDDVVDLGGEGGAARQLDLADVCVACQYLFAYCCPGWGPVPRVRHRWAQVRTMLVVFMLMFVSGAALGVLVAVMLHLLYEGQAGMVGLVAQYSSALGLTCTRTDAFREGPGFGFAAVDAFGVRVVVVVGHAVPSVDAFAVVAAGPASEVAVSWFLSRRRARCARLLVVL